MSSRSRSTMSAVVISGVMTLVLTLVYFFAFGVYLHAHHGFDKPGVNSGGVRMYETLHVFDPVHMAMDRSTWIERRLYDCAARANLLSALSSDHVRWIRRTK
jgi:hypothetical protein